MNDITFNDPTAQAQHKRISRLRSDLDALDADRLRMSEELLSISEENGRLRAELEHEVSLSTSRFEAIERVRHELSIWDYASRERIRAALDGEQ